MTRVLLIAPACDGEDVGESWVAFQWVKELADRFDVTLVTTYKRGHRPPSVQLPGVHVVEWQEPALVGRFERFNSLLQPGYLPFYVRARRWIKSQALAGVNFDIIHQVVPVAIRYPCPGIGLGFPVIMGPVGGSIESPQAFIAEEGAAPWYQRLRRLDAWRIRHDPLLRHTYEGASCVLGVADYVREFLSGIDIRRFEIMSETAVHAIKAPVDRSLHSGPVRLLYVGRIIRTKGLRDLVRAMSQLSDLDVTLDVLGDGNDREACEALARELDVAPRITFHGVVPRSQVDDFYTESDIFVFPSYREPGGNVSLEAMGAGLPLIVCRRGGPGANVDDSCAIKLDAESPAQLAEDCAVAIRRLVENPDLRLAMGRAARVHAEGHHLWSARAQRMATLYADVARTG